MLLCKANAANNHSNKILLRNLGFFKLKSFFSYWGKFTLMYRSLQRRQTVVWGLEAHFLFEISSLFYHKLAKPSRWMLNVSLKLLRTLWNTFYTIPLSGWARNAAGDCRGFYQWTYRQIARDDRHGRTWAKYTHFSWKMEHDKAIPLWSEEIEAGASECSILDTTAVLGSHEPTSPTNITFFKWLEVPTGTKDKGTSKEASAHLTARKPSIKDCNTVVKLGIVPSSLSLVTSSAAKLQPSFFN